MNILLAPDIYVNASVAMGTPPEAVVQRVLGKHKGESKTSEWILGRVHQMLAALPEFKEDAVDAQIELIRGLVQVVDVNDDFDATNWEAALVATAKQADVKRVLTDHPDLLEKKTAEGVEFVASEDWLKEVATPPPVPK